MNEKNQRIFLRALVYSEHFAIFASGCAWLTFWLHPSQFTLPGISFHWALLALGVGVSCLASLLLAALMMRAALPFWSAALACAISGPILSFGLLFVALRSL